MFTIELTDDHTGQPVLINLEQVLYMETTPGGTGTVIRFLDHVLPVQESYEKIRQVIGLPPRATHQGNEVAS